MRERIVKLNSADIFVWEDVQTGMPAPVDGLCKEIILTVKRFPVGNIEDVKIVPEKKGYSDYQGLRAFYGALLKQLPQPTTLAKDFSLIPLLELSGGRVKNLPEPLSFHNIVLPVPGPSQVINSDIK